MLRLCRLVKPATTLKLILTTCCVVCMESKRSTLRTLLFQLFKPVLLLKHSLFFLKIVSFWPMYISTLIRFNAAVSKNQFGLSVGNKNFCLCNICYHEFLIIIVLM